MNNKNTFKNGLIEFTPIDVTDKKQLLLIINDKTYISIHMNDVLEICEAIKCNETVERTYYCNWINNGYRETPLYFQYKENRYSVMVDSVDIKITDNIFDSFSLCGFMKDFIIKHSPEDVDLQNNIKMASDSLKRRDGARNQAIQYLLEEAEDKL